MYSNHGDLAILDIHFYLKSNIYLKKHSLYHVDNFLMNAYFLLNANFLLNAISKAYHLYCSLNMWHVNFR